MTFDEISDTDFENLCHDLLNELGMQKVNWRKGTGKDTSPADGGRDIECEYHRYDAVLKRNVIEKWHVECKHYQSGVPWDKISNAFSMAQSNRPDRLIVIVSNFLSNPCKEAIEGYKLKNLPTFEIDVWEKPFLENMLLSYPHLLKRYGIEHREYILDCLNQNHIEYMKSQPYNHYHHLNEALMLISPSDVEKICDLCCFVYGRFLDDVVGEIRNKSSVEFVQSKVVCVAEHTSEQFAVQSFVMTVLELLLSYIHTNSEKIYIEREKHIEFAIKNKKRILERMKDIYPDYEEINDVRIRELLGGKQEDIQRNLDDMKRIYNSFCDGVIRYLLENQFNEI